MKIILASSFNNYKKDKNGNKRPIVLPDDNLFLSTIKNNVKSLHNVVFVVSDPTTFTLNDSFGELLFNSLSLSGLNVENKIILDNRNKQKAAEIIAEADLIFLAGGKVSTQSKFFNEIQLKKILANYKGLIIGGSAGAMNLCETVVNFDDKCFIKGIGFFDKIIIPHFDGENKKYIRDGKDALKDLLELSENTEIIAFNDEAFILKTEDNIKYFGNFYLIKNAQIKKMSTQH